MEERLKCRLLRARSRVRNVQRFRGGLAFKAHRLLYHATLGLRVIKKKKKCRLRRARSRVRMSGATIGAKSASWHQKIIIARGKSSNSQHFWRVSRVRINFTRRWCDENSSNPCTLSVALGWVLRCNDQEFVISWVSNKFHQQPLHPTTSQLQQRPITLHQSWWGLHHHAQGHRAQSTRGKILIQQRVVYIRGARNLDNAGVGGRRNVKRLRGGLVFKAHRLCVSLNPRLESNKEERREAQLHRAQSTPGKHLIHRGSYIYEGLATWKMRGWGIAKM